MKWYEKIKEAVHDDKNIKGFFGGYRWLSNFEPCLVEYVGLVFPSSEAAYQAMKCLFEEDRKKFLNITASEAKKLGRKIEIRPDWDLVKVLTMEEILFNKFNKNDHLRQRLIQTGEKYLEETNWWNDKFWGVCNGNGQNNLGKILMKVRKELNDAQ